MNEMGRLQEFAAGDGGEPAEERARVWARLQAGSSTRKPSRRKGRSGLVLTLAVAWVALIGLLGYAIGAEPSGADQDSPSASAPGPLLQIQGESLELFSTDTPSSVVTWADNIVIATAVSEKPLGPIDGYASDGSEDGLLGREVAFEVDRVLWERDGSVELEEEFVSDTWGWAITDGKVTPFGVEDGPRFEVGQTYLVTVARDGAQWLALDGASYAVAEDGKLASSQDQSDPADTFAAAVRERSIDQLPEYLSQVEPLRGARPFLDLPLRKRLLAVPVP